MTDNYYIAEGRPFSGRECDRLKAFLKERGLDYDDKITYTACIMDENTGEIAATGSISGIILKCVAVSEHYHGQGLLSDLMSKLYEEMYNKGTVHFVGFTKPKNLDIFKHMGLYPIVETEHIVYLENKKDEFSKYLKRLREKSDKLISEFEDASENENVRCSALENVFMEELSKAAFAGDPETLTFPGYLIPAQQIPTYFIQDKENALAYREELVDKLKAMVRDALGL
ncbi:hypothetical protein [Oribacterium sp. WCC10]|uniref:hypothetical protein n=1 Tax=Oribacterium sp. WCC10 TaxID=1855343 RepID=UPI0008DFE6A7|nr:hypothetical protein [Oribacterium sp. WCC10]SFG53400.1 hypothetical protein SAMN05216356_11220 [Oribacterium sp. WCC10]